MLGSVVFLKWTFKPLKTMSGEREFGQQSRRQTGSLLVMRRLVLGSSNECRESGKPQMTIMLTPQDDGEDKVRKKIKKILITRISD